MHAQIIADKHGNVVYLGDTTVLTLCVDSQR